MRGNAVKRLIELLGKGGVRASVVDAGTASSGAVSIPLGSSKSLVLCDGADVSLALSILAGDFAGMECTEGVKRSKAAQRILNGLYDENDSAGHIPEMDSSAQRCVMVFQSREDLTPLERALAELFPESGGDIAVEMGEGRMAVVKQMNDAQWNDLVDLCLAILDTVRNESSMRIVVGIGDGKVGIRRLAASYQEALEAIKTGARFHPAHTIYVYRTLIIERFLQEVPARMLREYHGQLFGLHNEKLLNDEMLQTVDKFFECDLNLSEAARQLYIHRNTLVYRLDKFQRATGLDLRRFDDAVIYKLLHMMGAGEPANTY